MRCINRVRAYNRCKRERFPQERGYAMGRKAGSVSMRGDARVNVRALLGDRGTLGDDARTAVGYAYGARCGEYHVAPRRAYDRARERMDYGTHGADVRVTWPLRAYDAQGTGDVRTHDLRDTSRLSDALRASLRRARYAGSAAWDMRAMERAHA